MLSALSTVRWCHQARMGKSQGVKRYTRDYAFHLCEYPSVCVCVCVGFAHVLAQLGWEGPASDRLSSWTSPHFSTLLCFRPPHSATSLRLKPSKQIENNSNARHLLLRWPHVGRWEPALFLMYTSAASGVKWELSHILKQDIFTHLALVSNHPRTSGFISLHFSLHVSCLLWMNLKLS